MMPSSRRVAREPADRVTLSISGLEVRPYPYQQEMLDAIEVERVVHDRHRNLVVAATGTGKTVIAALDYRRLCEASRRRPTPSLRRSPTRDPGAVAPHLSRSPGGRRLRRALRGRRAAGTLAARVRQRAVADGVRRRQHPADAFDVVVIDEFHHAEAKTYRRILDHLRPRELLGPHRDARARGWHGCAVLLRRSHRGRASPVGRARRRPALPVPLLRRGRRHGSPVDHAGRGDGTTKRNSPTSSRATTHGLRIVLSQLRDKVADVGAMRALGFCVSVAHAEYMAQRLQRSWDPGSAMSGQTPRDERAARLPTCARGESTSCSPSTCSTRASTSPTSTRSCSCGRPRARRSSSSSSDVGSTHARQGGADGAGLRRLSPQGVPLRPEVASPDRDDTRRPRATGRGGVPIPPGRLLRSRWTGKSQTLVLENIRSQIANRWQQIVAELRTSRRARPRRDSSRSPASS